MKSTRVTKHNKLRKNSKLKKRVIRGGTKKGNKKHVKRSIEKKSRKIGGSSDTNGEVETGRVKALIKHFQKVSQPKPAIQPVAHSSKKKKVATTLTGENPPKNTATENPAYNTSVDGLLNSEGNPYGGKYNHIGRNRPNPPRPGYDVLGKKRPIKPRTSEAYNTPSNLLLLMRIVNQIDIDNQTQDDKEKIEDALARANSLSPDELENLKAELEQLIDNQQPLYAVANGPNETSAATERLYETVEPPPALQQPQSPPSASPPPPLPPRIKCSGRKKKECEESDGCKFVQTDGTWFGLPIKRKIKTCVHESAVEPRINPNTSGQNTSGSVYEEPNNLSIA